MKGQLINAAIWIFVVVYLVFMWTGEATGSLMGVM